MYSMRVFTDEPNNKLELKVREIARKEDFGGVFLFIDGLYF